MGIFAVVLVGVGGGLVAGSAVTKKHGIRTRVAALLVGAGLIGAVVGPELMRANPPATAPIPAPVAGGGK